MQKRVPLDPLFPDAPQRKQEADAFLLVQPEPIDLLFGLRKPAAPQDKSKLTPAPYTHIDATTCPARGCGRPMERAFLENNEEVSFCPHHRIAFPLPL